MLPTQNHILENCKPSIKDVQYFNIRCVSRSKLELEKYEPLKGLSGRPRVQSNLYSYYMYYEIRDVIGTCDNANITQWIDVLSKRGFENGIGHMVEIFHQKDDGTVDYIECSVIPRYNQGITYEIFENANDILYGVDTIYGGSEFHQPQIWK